MNTTLAPRACEPADVGMTFEADAPITLIETCTRYLAQFEAPRDETKDRCECGSRLTGIFGSFVWGLAHGEGSCSNCGRRARAFHVIRDSEPEPLLQFVRVLLYRVPEPS